MSTIDQQLAEAYQDVLRKEKIMLHMDVLDVQIREKQIELLRLEEILDKEEREYSSLKNVGISGLFSKILGNYEKRLDKEKQEYLLAYLKFDDCKKAIQQATEEKELLRKPLYALQNAEKRLERLLVKKKQLLIEQKPETAERILRLERNIAGYKARLKELHEAIQAGEKAKEMLSEIIKELEYIKDWGSITYGGKGSHSSYKKKRYIDKATQQVFEANGLLIQFENELSDVTKHFKLHYEEDIRYFKEFVDDFFNNLITDWVIRKKIRNSLHGVSSALDRVEMTIITLKEEIEKAAMYVVKDDKAKKELLLTL